MMQRENFAALDWFRIAAAVLVVANHTSPLLGLSAEADFLLTRVLARLAVPFFLMVTGYFLAAGGWRGAGKTVKKLLFYDLLATALYLPLSASLIGWDWAEWLRRLLIDGTLYHLWYFPAAILGIGVVCALRRLGTAGALTAAGALYVLGLMGDSYWGLTAQLPALDEFYDHVVFALTDYTRNGLFYAPLFLLLGGAGFRMRRGPSALCFAAALAAMAAEAWTLRGLGWQKHDSMYILLPLTMLFLFSLLLSADRGQHPALRRVSLLIYILHPWCIVLVRGAAEAVGARPLLVECAPVHFLAVLAMSVLLALLLAALPLPQKCAPTARAWREIDLEALRRNAAALQSCLGRRCRLMAVVKAQAYGHGGVLCARALQKAGVRAFAVATLSEAVQLRKAGIRGIILILGYTPPTQARALRFWRLTQTVVDARHAAALERMCVPLHIHIAVDTGMHRLGVDAEDLEALRRIYQSRYLKVDGIFSHLCVSDSLEEADVRYTALQAGRFYAAVDDLRRSLDCGVGKIHLQASYGALNLPPQPCDYGRMGIALYGVYSDDAPVRREVDLRPVLSLRARIASVRTLPAGESAGYGLAFTAARPTRLAVAAIGYADGLPRDWPERGGGALLHGVFVPAVGRLCMDQMLLDVTDVPGARQGDVITLLGRDGDACIRAESVARQCGTISNELLSRLGQRLPVVPRGR